MNNIIRNSNWEPGPLKGPLFFSGWGPITYDICFLNGARICSLTQHNGTAGIVYDPLIKVIRRSAFTWGLHIRKEFAEKIFLQAQFYDENQIFLCKSCNDITDRISSEFSEVKSNFDIPCSAETVQLSIHLEGAITACSMCMPFAYFY